MSAIDLNGSGMREAEVWEQKGYAREVQDGIEESKHGSGRARRREGWTRDIWGEGSVDQDRGPRVRVNRLDLGAGWWTRRFKGTRGNQVTSGPAETFC